MDPGLRSHGMKADPPGYIRSKYECFLMNAWWDILHSSCLHVKLLNNSTNGTEVRTNEQTNERTNIRTDEQKDENYIPLDINAGGIKSQVVNQIWLTSNFASFWHQRYKFTYSNISHIQILNLTSTNYYQVKHFESTDPAFQKQG